MTAKIAQYFFRVRITKPLLPHKKQRIILIRKMHAGMDTMFFISSDVLFVSTHDTEVFYWR